MRATERSQPSERDRRNSVPVTLTAAPPHPVPLRNARGDVIAIATVDAADLELVKQHTWHLHSDGYAFRRLGSGPSRAIEYMHRLILDAPTGALVDHADGNRLNNTRPNLRLATPSQNNANSADRPRRSGYRGVYPNRPTGRWIAQISVDGRVRHLGLYDRPEEAACAYDTAARAQWGQFARTSGLA